MCLGLIDGSNQGGGGDYRRYGPAQMGSLLPVLSLSKPLVVLTVAGGYAYALRYAVQKLFTRSPIRCL